MNTVKRIKYTPWLEEDSLCLEVKARHSIMWTLCPSLSSMALWLCVSTAVESLRLIHKSAAEAVNVIVTILSGTCCDRGGLVWVLVWENAPAGCQAEQLGRRGLNSIFVLSRALAYPNLSCKIKIGFEKLQKICTCPCGLTQVTSHERGNQLRVRWR